jgi:hypothetical protein
MQNLVLVTQIMANASNPYVEYGASVFVIALTSVFG